MPEIEERREGGRVRIDCPAILFWEHGDGACEVKGQVLELGSGGMSVRTAAKLKVDTILYCAVPSYGIYSRARVMHARGLMRRTAGLQFLAGNFYAV